MKASDIRKCDLCGEPVAGKTRSGNQLMFHRLVIERHMLDMRSIRQATGLTLFLGSAELADVMGAPDQVSICTSRREVLACEPCVVDELIGLFTIEEKNKGRELDPDPEMLAARKAGEHS